MRWGAAYPSWAGASAPLPVPPPLQPLSAAGRAPQVVLGDRPLTVTLARVWAALSFWEKIKLSASLLWTGKRSRAAQPGAALHAAAPCTPCVSTNFACTPAHERLRGSCGLSAGLQMLDSEDMKKEIERMKVRELMDAHVGREAS